MQCAWPLKNKQRLLFMPTTEAVFFTDVNGKTIVKRKNCDTLSTFFGRKIEISYV